MEYNSNYTNFSLRVIHPAIFACIAFLNYCDTYLEWHMEIYQLDYDTIRFS